MHQGRAIVNWFWMSPTSLDCGRLPARRFAVFPEDEDLAPLHSALAALSPGEAVQLPPPRPPPPQPPVTQQLQQSGPATDQGDSAVHSEPLCEDSIPSHGGPDGSPTAAAADSGGSPGLSGDGSGGSGALPAQQVSAASPTASTVAERGHSARPAISGDLGSGQPGGAGIHRPEAAGAAAAGDAIRRLSLPRDRNTQVLYLINP